MNESYFGFRDEPFDPKPDPSFLFTSKGQQAAYQNIYAAVRLSRPLILLAGQSGVGKTVLLRQLSDQLDMASAWVFSPSQAQLTADGFLGACCDFANIPADTATARRAAFEDFLIAHRHADGLAVIILDEAHDLSDDVLEETSQIAGMQRGAAPLFSLVMAGQPGFEAQLQRYGVLSMLLTAAERVHLEPLTEYDVGAFIHHQLDAAGYHGPELFSPDAVQCVARHSKGLPRLVNMLCASALLITSVEDRKTVSANTVEQAAQDCMLSTRPKVPVSSVMDVDAPDSGDTAPRPVFHHAVAAAAQKMPASNRDKQMDGLLLPEESESDLLREDSAPTVTNVPIAVLDPAANEKAPSATRTVAPGIPTVSPEGSESSLVLPYGMRAEPDERQAVTGTASAPWYARAGILSGLAFLAVAIAAGAFFAHRQGYFRNDSNTEPPDVAVERDTPAEVLEGETQNSAALAAAYSNLAIVYQTRGDLDQAETMYRKALDVHQGMGNEQGAAREFNNIGLIHWSRGELDRAEAMYKKSLELHEAAGDRAGIADNQTNLGSLYWSRKDLENAEARYREALAINKTLGRKRQLANGHSNLGIIHHARGQLDEAKTSYLEALEVYEALGQPTEGTANTYANLGNLYKTLGDLEQAEKSYRKSLELYRQVGVSPKVRQAREWLETLRDGQ